MDQAMKIEVTRRQPGLDCGAGMQTRVPHSAPVLAGAEAVAPNEADFAPPVAPLTMPKQQIEATGGWSRLRLPWPGRRMQGQP